MESFKKRIEKETLLQYKSDVIYKIGSILVISLILFFIINVAFFDFKWLSYLNEAAYYVFEIFYKIVDSVSQVIRNAIQ